MISLPPCVLYTQDPSFTERVRRVLHSIAHVCLVDAPLQIDLQLRQTGPTILLVDLRCGQATEVLKRVLKAWPLTVAITFGTLRSEPMLEAEALNVYATEDLKLDHQHFKKLIRRALDYLKLLVENQMFREENTRLSVSQSVVAAQRSERSATPLPLRHLYRAFRHFDNVEALLEGIVEGVASTTLVSRVGIVSWARNSSTYCLRAGLRCLDTARTIEYREEDPFIRWLEVNAHLISRSTLEHINNPSERALLKQTLDAFGAEVIIPLQARKRMIGWLFIGHRTAGIPFDHSDLEDLMIVAEHISTNLENALLYEEAAVQKTLLETLLHSMSTGIVAVDVDGKVRWFNKAAQNLLSVSSDEVIGRSVESLGSRLADLFLRTLRMEKTIRKRQWTDPATNRTLSVEVRCLMEKNIGMGGMAMVEDLTAVQLLREKQEQLERSKFWADLAAKMSHQIRNPLVAIQTFAQLLPERYDDPDFRNEFWKLVPKEVERLDKIIRLINNFAHPPELQFKPLDLEKTIRLSIDKARKRFPSDNITISTSIEKDLQRIKGDEIAITECLVHLIANAVEATAHQTQPLLTLSARILKGTEDQVSVAVEDNGCGIPIELQGKIFSPFCTTKPQGMGLGLPIVKRTVLDHNGHVYVDSSPKGTKVTFVFPTAQTTEPT